MIQNFKDKETQKIFKRERYSIRINEQWRICFEWQDGKAFNVEIVDYH